MIDEDLQKFSENRVMRTIAIGRVPIRNLPKSATNEQIKTLCEICQNVLAGNVSKAKIRQLCRYKKVIRQLADRNIPIARKRELLTNQTGGFLPLVLPAVLSLVGGLVGKAIEIRVEDNISNLLHDEETPDDMKARLLSHWIPKYQLLMQPSPPPKPFEIPKELLQET
ncbi:hypothetical protein AVEN_32544-1 [Araneus ventricosus]|uniref:Uncharacterized protein n=1 Tax=Araneus ventricosus TaxID=182803 RepID=A0A4Y2JJ73_ARAVE|nr:hypothetical protein AVEN_32544-1 [Araneus ventricosus]